MAPPKRPSRILVLPNKALFDGEAALMQRSSSDIVVYAPMLYIVVKIAWPTVGDIQVPPDLLLRYLVKENVLWSCFCSLHNRDDAPLSCRILTWPHEGTYAFCHYDKPRCQFFLSLDDLFHSSTRKEPYAPIGKGRLEPDSILARYLLTETNESIEHPLTQALYAPGYLGEYHHGKQLGSLAFNDMASAIAPYFSEMAETSDSSSEHGMKSGKAKSSCGIQVDTPYSFLPPRDLNVLDLPELQLVHRLALGLPLKKDEAKRLLSPSRACGQFFLRRVLKDHIEECSKPRRKSLRRPARAEDAANLDSQRAQRKKQGYNIF
ncbi:hypothetical protein B0H19DRAFT_1271287 [Mycena capillaripes]|nr:hypothetical protein B0H19DRAFT_1271287 [Mycena capillaripes]